MKAFQILHISIFSTLVLVAASSAARAIPLPDNSSKNCSGANGCFKITNTGTSEVAIVASAATNGTAVWGTALGTGTGILGDAASGTAVSGRTTSGYGVYAYASGSGGRAVNAIALSGEAVYGTSSGGNAVVGSSTGLTTGVYGVNTSAQGNGVLGQNTGSGVGVFGDNANPSGWAGFFNGRAFTTLGVWSGSDARLKKDVRDVACGLDRVLKLRPVTYKWRKGGGDDKTQLGLIAQEVQKIVPEVVTADGTSGMLSINYTALLPIMIKAVQEQQRIIQTQEARIASLERGGKTTLSSLVTGSLGAGLVFGLVPLGLVAARRRRTGSRTN